jgi:hypothetical protein
MGRNIGTVIARETMRWKEIGMIKLQVVDNSVGEEVVE